MFASQLAKAFFAMDCVGTCLLDAMALETVFMEKMKKDAVC